MSVTREPNVLRRNVAAVLFMACLGFRFIGPLAWFVNPSGESFVYGLMSFLIAIPIRILADIVMNEPMATVRTSIEVRRMSVAQRLSYIRWLHLAAHWGGEWGHGGRL